MPAFEVVSDWAPAGDQPEAIAALAAGIENGLDEQTLLGVTGSGKTFTMAKVIEKVQRPTLVLAHNKILAAQLCAEFKEFFPNNAVEYFVSYYDYYQPEAYIPHTDTFIEKDSAVNEEIDRLRLSATASLMERRDVIVISSVSCIYGLGEPEDFAKMMVSLRVGATMKIDELLRRLAVDNGLPWQTKHMIAGGNDASAVQRSREGVRTATIAAAVRYLHAPASVGCIRDFDGILALTRLFLQAVADGAAGR